MSATGTGGLQATYHPILEKVKLLLAEKLRLLYYMEGPKVLFWAPACTGLADMARPAQKLSAAQSITLMATGFMWPGYSLVIAPKTWSLFAVNFFVGAAGAFHFFYNWRYNQELKAKANK
ncbi:mitochondrial pyruvate carrier 2-like [Lontra canadensis]|uniref:mitochondrial pyruvate carrier 2-like n=1 Tax=Lontra canadensis TaxID=76717 RepID=UPI0013F36A0D|nr:mitochondrial pyruvate carrier 2-like [Lontra canadensis]